MLYNFCKKHPRKDLAGQYVTNKYINTCGQTYIFPLHFGKYIYLFAITQVRRTLQGLFLVIIIYHIFLIVESTKDIKS